MIGDNLMNTFIHWSSIIIKKVADEENQSLLAALSRIVR